MLYTSTRNVLQILEKIGASVRDGAVRNGAVKLHKLCAAAIDSVLYPVVSQHL